MTYDRYKAEQRRPRYEAKIDRNSDEVLRDEYRGQQMRKSWLSYWQSRNGKQGHVDRRAA